MEEDANKQTQGEFLTGGRLIPIGREGNKVFARTLRPGEEDTGEVVHLEPGDQLVIPAGGLTVDSREIDAQSTEGLGGYAPVANTVWTWYRIVGEELGFFLFFFSLARRTDAAHALWTLTIQERDKARLEGGIPRRTGFLTTLATAEVAVIALHRGIAMVYSLNERFDLGLQVPESVQQINLAVEEMRHAFEHIDDRAEGRVGMSRRVDPEALSIFDQPDFVESSVLRYKTHSLNFKEQVLSALLDCREFIMDAIDARASSNTKARASSDE